MQILNSPEGSGSTVLLITRESEQWKARGVANAETERIRGRVIGAVGGEISTWELPLSSDKPVLRLYVGKGQHSQKTLLNLT